MIKSRLKNIKLLAMDFDGVHTDGYVYVGQNGDEFVKCSRKDSLGLNMLMRANVALVVISKEKSSVVKERCKKLGVECFSGVENARSKAEILQSLMDREGFTQEQVAFIGDDINDIDALMLAGISITPADGHKSVREIVDLTLSKNGGDHALRELSELILDAKKETLKF